MNLYIDVLFAVNVWMNMGLLWLTGICLRYRRKGLWIVSGAAVGGLWSCLLILLPFCFRAWPLPRWGELLLTYLGIGPAMCRIAFGRRRAAELFRASLMLAVVSIFIGGFLNQLYFHTGAGYVMRELLTGRSAQGGGLSVLLLLAAASFFAGKELLLFFSAGIRSRENLVQVHLVRGEKRITVTALLDTGNRLYEPATGLPVSVGEKEALRELFPEPEEDTGFFLIPYRSVGGEGFLKGKRLDFMEIILQGETVTKIDGPLVIALREGSLSSDGSYQLILHHEFTDVTASSGKRRKKYGRQSSSSKQVSAQIHHQHEESSVFKEKRSPLHRGQRCPSGTVFTGNRGSDDRQAGNTGGEGGESRSDRA